MDILDIPLRPLVLIMFLTWHLNTATMEQLNRMVTMVKYPKLGLTPGDLEHKSSCVLWSDGPDSLPKVEATVESIWYL